MSPGICRDFHAIKAARTMHPVIADGMIGLASGAYISEPAKDNLGS
jgi:hypothetical protein